jgi:hypothetical protein
MSIHFSPSNKDMHAFLAKTTCCPHRRVQVCKNFPKVGVYHLKWRDRSGPIDLFQYHWKEQVVSFETRKAK